MPATLSGGILSKASGSVTINYVRLQNVTATGGANFTANNVSDLGNNNGWNLISPPSQNLYWIGNSGNWNDTNHWSLSSGGTSSGCIPSPYDNVYFNANSFSGGGIVTIDQEAYCKTIDWTGAVSSATLAGNQKLNIYGALVLSSTMNITHTGGIYFKSSTTGNVIQTFGKTITSNFYFDGLGEWVLQDNLTFSSSYPYGGIYLNTGSLNTNNVIINAYFFSSSGSGIRLLNLGSSTISVSKTSYSPYAWDVSGSNIAVNPGTSTIILTGSSGDVVFDGGSLNYYNVTFNNANANGILYGSGTTFNNVTFAGKANIYNGNKIFNNLTLGTSKSTNLGNNTVTINGTFICNGTSGNLASINNGNISKSAGTVCINYVNLTSVKATGGATFYAGNSQNLGNNTGWIFQTCSSNNTNIVYPKLILSTSSINTGESITIIGNDFTAAGQVSLGFAGPSGVNIPTVQLTANNLGKFSYVLETTGFPGGTYYTVGHDVTSNQFSPYRSFEIIEVDTTTKFKLIAPLGEFVSYLGDPIRFEWKDQLVPNGIANIIGAQREYNYKIGLSSNNGSTWQLIDSSKGYGTIGSFKMLYFNLTGLDIGSNYKLKVIDSFEQNRFIISSRFSVIQRLQNDLEVSYEWDYSYPNDRNGKPIGLAADGVSRIYLKINSNQPTNLNQVKLTLYDGRNNVTRTLGKLKNATIINSWSDEANDASNITVTNTSPQDGSFWFWYVSPDDFVGADSYDSLRSERNIFFIIDAFYQGGAQSKDTVMIKIIRPPLILVHGLGGSADTWKNFSYLDQGWGLPFPFVTSSLFKLVKPVNLIPNDYFEGNAPLLLVGIIRLIKEMRSLGYASNQVSYVCHSMGGNIIRTAIQKFNSSYFINTNYSKGYVNRSIFLDTPHYGSPWADILSNEMLNYLNSQTEFRIYLFSLYMIFQNRGGFFPANLWEPYDFNILGIPKFRSTGALLNLRVNGGYTLQPTNVKYHLIAGDINPGMQAIGDPIPPYITQPIQYNKTLLNLIDFNLNLAYIIAPLPLKAILRPIKELADQATRCVNFLDAMFKETTVQYFINESDLVVSLQSQLSGLLRNSSNVTVFDGIGHNDLILKGVLDDRDVGSRVLKLLNSNSQSNLFGTQISGSTSYSHESKLDKLTAKNITFKENSSELTILRPIENSTQYVDSTMKITLILSDTLGLDYVWVMFQDQTFFINEKVNQIDLALQVTCSQIGSQRISISAYYDYLDSSKLVSTGIDVNVEQSSNLISFQANPILLELNIGERKSPYFDAYYENGITHLPINYPGLSINIQNPTIVTIDSTGTSFIGKSTGETSAIFTYNGFIDTVYFVTTSDTVTTDIKIGNESIITKSFELSQNFPNPFNPTTKINYSLLRASKVTIKVFNILGEEVKTVINEYQNAGRYTVNVDLGSFASGVYIYQMRADEFTSAKKFILLK